MTERPLPTNPGYYEAACVDEFTVYLPKSQVKKLSIRHDNTGHGADWFLDFVSLQCKDCASGQDGITYFPCFAWLKVWLLQSQTWGTPYAQPLSCVLKLPRVGWHIAYTMWPWGTGSCAG